MPTGAAQHPYDAPLATGRLALDGIEHLSALSASTSRRTEAHVRLRELLVDVGSHFGEQEAAMQRADYPERTRHMRQHFAMMTELGLLLGEWDESSQTEIVRRTAFVEEWFRRHAAHADTEFTTWLATRPA